MINSHREFRVDNSDQHGKETVEILSLTDTFKLQMLHFAIMEMPKDYNKIIFRKKPEDFMHSICD